MKTVPTFLLVVVVLFIGASGARAIATDNAFAEGWFLNTVRTIVDPAQTQSRDSNGITIVSGGNAGAYPNPTNAIPQATTALNGTTTTVCLAQSSFGQMVAGTLGFPNAKSVLLAEGTDLLKLSAPYAVFANLSDLPVPAGDGLWDIRFPGVINPATGLAFPNQNWFETTNRLAELRFRAALRIDSSSADAARGLLAVLHQRVVPRTFAGNNAFVRASFERLSGQNPALSEGALLETNALPFFEAAAQQVLLALQSLPDATLLDGTYPHIAPAALSPQVQRLLDAYARSLAAQGETVLKLGQLKYFGAYADPTSGAYNPQSLLTFLDRKITGLQQQLLAVNAFASRPALQGSDLGKATHLVQELLRLRTSVADGRVAFKGALVASLEDAVASSYTYREYAPEFVPFLWDPSEFASYPNSFRKLLADATSQAQRSESLDAAAVTHIQQQAMDAHQLSEDLARIQVRYENELGELCGFIRLDNGVLIPDVLFGLLAPGDREQFHNYSASDSKGKIFAQWQNVFQAETQLRIAVQELSNVLSKIERKQEVARQISGGQSNIANLVLQNGDKLAALDEEEGDAYAEAILTTARARTQEGVRRGIFDTVVQTGTAVGTGNYPGLVGAASTAFDTWNKAECSYQVAEAQANLQRRLGKIQGQRTKIAAMERASILFERARAELLRTEEAIHALCLEAERQKLNILLAEQSLDMQRLELANITGRVRFLIQEYLQAQQLQSENPLRNPDYRHLRDLAVRDAEESFVNAQERAYLAAKAAQYRVNHGQQAGTVNALLSSIMAARRGAALVQALDSLRIQVDALFAQQGAQTAVQNPVLSLRHFLAQNNSVLITNQFGEWDAASASLEMFSTNGNARTVSDQEWIQFLRSHLVTNATFPELKLELGFSTSLNRPNRADIGAPDSMQNPLFNTTLINALIAYDPAANGYGIRVNLRGRDLAYNPNQQVLVDLRQEGASYIRSRKWLCDTNGSAIRVWNLAPVQGQLVAAINGQAQGSPQFHERSAANDRWIFSISSLNGGNNGTVLNQIERITDIEIVFSIRGFTPPDCN